MSAPLPPDFKARLLAEVKVTPAPPRADVARKRALYIACGFGWTALMALVLGLRLGSRPAPFVIALTLSWAVIATAGTTFLVSRGPSMLGRSRASLVAAAVATPLALLATLGAIYAAWPEALDATCAPRIHAICFGTSVVMALGPLAAFALVRRDSDPVHPLVTALALAASASAWASFASVFHCPFSGLAHLLLGHVLPVVALALGGAWGVTQVVALRARAPRRERE